MNSFAGVQQVMSSRRRMGNPGRACPPRINDLVTQRSSIEITLHAFSALSQL